MLYLITWCTLNLVVGPVDRATKYRAPKKVGNVVTVERILNIKEGICFMVLFTCGLMMVTVSFPAKNKTVNKKQNNKTKSSIYGKKLRYIFLL